MTDHASTPLILMPGEGRSIDLGNFTMSVKADDDATAGAFTLLEAAEPAGFGPPVHVHANATEAFYVLEGEYTMYIEDQRHVCPAGSFVLVPAGIRHSFRVGQVASRKLNLFTPAAMVGYFDELAAAIRSGTVDDGRLDEIAVRFGMHVLGPAPEGYL